MLDFLYAILMVSLAISFLLFVCRKTGIINYLTAKADSKFVYNLLGCNFCLAFWLALIVSIFYVIFTGNFTYLTISVFVAPLVQGLLK